MTDLREAVEVEPVEVPSHYSQTQLSKADRCPFSAYLYVKHSGGVGSAAMDRGTAIHRFRERWLKMLLERNENSSDPEEAKPVLDHVLRESGDLVLPAAEQDDLRIMAHHIAEATWIDPAEVVAVEDTFEVQIGPKLVSGRIDLAVLVGTNVIVDDLKSGYNLPDQATFEGGFQLPVYAVAFSEGKIRGEPVGLGAGVTQFELRETYPMYWWEAEGTLAYRSLSLDYASVLDHKLYLERLVENTERAFAESKFRAVPGSHCNRCPAASECPLPVRLRDWQGELTASSSLEDAQVVATRWWFKKEGRARSEDAGGPSIKADWEMLKAWTDENGPLRFGADLVLVYVAKEQERRKRGDFRTAVEDAIAGRAEFRWEDWHKKSISTPLTLKTLSARELAEEGGDDADGTDA